MTSKDIIRGCNILISSNKGISLKEEYLLQAVEKVEVSKYKQLTYIELVSLARKLIYTNLGRKNITPRDLKKAVINLIVL